MIVTKQLLSGLFFILLGGGAASLSLRHSLGTMTRMGPGYFPLLIGSLLALIGVVVTIRSLLPAAENTPMERIAVRPLAILAAAVVAFALLLRPYGLVAAITALTAIGWTADRDRRLRELPVMIVVLCGIAYGVFVYALNINLRIWPF
jgi:hypothetical protein